MIRREKLCFEWILYIENVIREFFSSCGSCKNLLNFSIRDVIINFIKKIKMDIVLFL